jgi:DNA repair exonuclease SbcCD ATPase subunit
MTSAPIAAPVPALTPASVIAQATSVDTATQTGIEHHKLLHEKEDFVQRLQRENEELKEATAMAGSRADLLENDLKQSRLDNDKLREAAAAAKSKADRLEDTVKKSRLENNRLREAAATAKSRADRLQDNATQSQARSTELEKENKTLQGTTKSQDAEIKALRDALARKDKTLADHARNAESHARKIRELESLKAAECENCKRLSRDLEQMRRQRDEERHKTQEVESELAVEKRQSTHAAYIAVVKYSDLSSEKVKLESSNRQLKIQYDHMRGKVDELSEEKLRNDRQREDDAYKKAETAIRKKLEDAHKEQLAQLKQEHQQKVAERTQALLFWERNTTKMIDRKRAEDQAEIARLERKIYGLNHQLGRENENWVDLYNQRRAADKALKATQEELKATQKNVEDVRRKCLTEHPTPAQKAVQLGSRFVAFVTRKKEACMYGMAPYQRIFWTIFWAIIGKIEPYVAPLLALVAVFSLGFFVVLVKIVEDLFEFLKDPNAFSTSDENLDAASSTAQYQVQV